MRSKIERSKFFWGAATSSYQTEGGVNNNDWNYFTTSKSIKKRISTLTKPSIFYKDIRHLQLQPAGDAVRFWDSKYYLTDFDNARNLGLNSIRISLEWARIEPERNQWDQNAIDSYRQILLSIRDKGLEPIVTLNHLTLPLWVLTPPIQFKKKIYQYLMPNPIRQLPLDDPPSSDPFWRSLRGWENEETIQAFVKFVKVVVTEFKDLVDYWITINEPVASIIGGGYLAGISPPGFFLDGKRTRAVLHNLIEAHVQVYEKISELDDVDANNDKSPKNVGFSHLMMIVQPPLNSRKSADVEAAKNFSYFVNNYFLNAVMNGEEDVNYMNTLERYNKGSSNFRVNSRWKQKTDFIGLNYYRLLHVRRSQIIRISNAKFIGGAPVNKSGLSTGGLNDLGWEIYPNGLYEIIRSLQQWNHPIFITENGVADKSDTLRSQFIIDHIKEIKQCLNENINVIGYLHWSLMDNYEWHEGYKEESKFGLFSVDRSEASLPRIMTKGAKVLSRLINEYNVNQSDD